jgi:hypothetical protein
MIFLKKTPKEKMMKTKESRTARENGSLPPFYCSAIHLILEMDFVYIYIYIFLKKEAVPQLFWKGHLAFLSLFYLMAIWPLFFV